VEYITPSDIPPTIPHSRVSTDNLYEMAPPLNTASPHAIAPSEDVEPPDRSPELERQIVDRHFELLVEILESHNEQDTNNPEYILHLKGDYTRIGGAIRPKEPMDDVDRYYRERNPLHSSDEEVSDHEPSENDDDSTYDARYHNASAPGDTDDDDLESALRDLHMDPEVPVFTSLLEEVAPLPKALLPKAVQDGPAQSTPRKRPGSHRSMPRPSTSKPDADTVRDLKNKISELERKLQAETFNSESLRTQCNKMTEEMVALRLTQTKLDHTFQNLKDQLPELQRKLQAEIATSDALRQQHNKMMEELIRFGIIKVGVASKNIIPPEYLKEPIKLISYLKINFDWLQEQYLSQPQKLREAEAEIKKLRERLGTETDWWKVFLESSLNNTFVAELIKVENKGTAKAAFTPVREVEVYGGQVVEYQSINIQPDYKDYSPEERRLADYKQGRRYGSQSGDGAAFVSLPKTATPVESNGLVHAKLNGASSGQPSTVLKPNNGTGKIIFTPIREVATDIVPRLPGLPPPPKFNHYQTITVHPDCQSYSLEELRLEDYKQGRRYGWQIPMGRANPLVKPIGPTQAEPGRHAPAKPNGPTLADWNAPPLEKSNGLIKPGAALDFGKTNPMFNFVPSGPVNKLSVQPTTATKLPMFKIKNNLAETPRAKMSARSKEEVDDLPEMKADASTETKDTEDVKEETLEEALEGVHLE
jgi:hypothetical protein